MSITYSFIGAGNLARALVGGLTQSGFPKEHIVASNRSQDKLTGLVREFSIIRAATNLEAVEKGDVLVIAVRPQDIPALSSEIKEAVQRRNPLVISLAAGVSFEALGEYFGNRLAIVRTMPNTATLIQKGITVLVANTATTPEQKEISEIFFRSVGSTYWVENEKDLNAMTPFVGSSVAYLYLFIKALKSAISKSNMKPEIVDRLARETVFGAASLALNTNVSLDTLIDQVATRGGVTEPSLPIVYNGGMFASLKQAFEMVEQKCKKLN